MARAITVEKEEGRYAGEATGKVAYRAFFSGKEEDVKGCPLGRSGSEDGAIADLLYRTNFESGLSLVADDLVVGTYRDFT